MSLKSGGSPIPKLIKAHQELNKAVDLCYRSNPFVNDTKRIEYLFELYEKYDNKLISDGSTKKVRKTKK